MPYELVWESRCLVRRYSGVATGDELVSSLREVCSDPRFDEIQCCIADYSQVQSLAVCEDNAMLVAALQIGSRFTDPGLLSVSVATDPGVIAEIKRIGRLFQPEAYVHFGATLDEARIWIRCRGGLDCGSPGADPAAG